jgi:hypothetical protein
MEKVASDSAGRLKKACSHLSEEEFEALVNTMTKVQHGDELRSRWSPPVILKGRQVHNDSASATAIDATTSESPLELLLPGPQAMHD